MDSTKGSRGLQGLVSPVRSRSTVLILGFVIAAASIGLLLWILAFTGALSTGPSRLPFWEITSFITVLVILGAAAPLIISIRAHARGLNRNGAAARA